MNNKYFPLLFSTILISGCSLTDTVMKGYIESVSGKSYVNSAEDASLLGRYAKTLEACKTDIPPHDYGRYMVDLVWLTNQVDTEPERQAYSHAYYDSTLPNQSCTDIKYTAETWYQIHLEEKRKLNQ